ncbi:telomere-associated recQ-like helicase [Fusarium phyllophilum]|uniref:Telomere-associated recQ-like helicase n=1 Tax=Fusarium phyllophilum TaxID=47803 RepID=A0A8H5IDQ2_9HYPO|nr:telomere-associated recQ-like helicase [Fusarium phyllophilum]
MSNQRDGSAAGDSISLIPANILECHQRFESDVETPYFVSLPLEPRLFQIIRPQLLHLFRRYDYDGDAGIIILRMASKVHDDFALNFGDLLQQLIDDILRKVPNAPRVRNRQTRKVKLWEHDRSKRGRECHPDGQFKDARAYQPGLVFEVGYSQTADSLEKIAKEYILGTEGDVTTVVCFDLKYNQGASFVSIWRARWNPSSNTVEAVCDLEPSMFQDSDGKMVNGDKLLKLGLTDMAEEKYSDDYPLAPIHIPFSQLSDIFDFAKAESAQKKSP